MDLIRDSENCRAVGILNLVYYCGELPRRALRVYGSSAKYMSKVVLKMSRRGYIRIEKVLGRQTIRLGDNKVDNEYLFIGAEESYRMIRNEIREADRNRRYRNISRAETCAFIKQAGFSLYPDEKPYLKRHLLQADTEAFYTTREIKDLMDIEYNGTYATRAIGVLVAGVNLHMVYYISKKRIRVSEFTEYTSVDEFTRVLNGKHEWAIQNEKFIHFGDAIILTFDYGKVLQNLITGKESSNHGKKEYFFSLDLTYEDYRLIPYTKFGAELLKLYANPKMDEWFKNICIEDDEKLEYLLDFPCDSVTDEGFWLIFMDGRLKRLKRFLSKASIDVKSRYHIICMDFQENGLLSIIPDNVTLHVHPVTDILELYNVMFRKEGGG